MQPAGGCQPQLQATDECFLMTTLSCRLAQQLKLLTPQATPRQVAKALYSTRVCPEYLQRAAQPQLNLAPHVVQASFEGRAVVSKVYHLDAQSILQPGHRSHLMELAWPAAGLLQPLGMGMGMVQATGLALKYMPDLSEVSGHSVSGPGIEATVLTRPAGRSLLELADAVHPATGAVDRHVDVKFITSTFKQVLYTMVHGFPKRFTHGDMKPNNISVEVKDGQLVITILDLGCSFMQGQDQGPLNCRIATPAFASPQRLASGNVSNADDRFAVGSSLLYTLCGNNHMHRLLQHSFGSAQQVWSNLLSWRQSRHNDMEEDDDDCSAEMHILLAPSCVPHHRVLLSDHRLESLRAQPAGQVVLQLLDVCAALMMPPDDEAYHVPLTQLLDTLTQLDDQVAALQQQTGDGHVLHLSNDVWPADGDMYNVVQRLCNEANPCSAPVDGDASSSVMSQEHEEQRYHHLKELRMAAAQARAERTRAGGQVDKAAAQQQAEDVVHVSIDWVPKVMPSPDAHVSIDWSKDVQLPTPLPCPPSSSDVFSFPEPSSLPPTPARLSLCEPAAVSSTEHQVAISCSLQELPLLGCDHVLGSSSGEVEDAGSELASLDGSTVTSSVRSSSDGGLSVLSVDLRSDSSSGDEDSSSSSCISHTGSSRHSKSGRRSRRRSRSSKGRSRSRRGRKSSRKSCSGRR